VRENIRQRFGARIRGLRAERGWTQEDLADKAGVGRVFISQLENGHKDVCLGVMEALAGSFKITLAEMSKGI
jgi:transcriptional regulator with XRE-family HTH domain